MRVPWFIATIAVCLLVFLADYLGNPSNGVWVYVITGLIILGINTFFWLPVVAYLRKNKKLSLGSSVISSVTAAVIGGACTIGMVYLFLYVAEQLQKMDAMMGQATGYTSWTIGHIHYWPGIAYIAVLWGINGAIFWVLYGKLAVNK